MATSMLESNVRLAQRLPPRLLNFFKKYPPPQLRIGAAAPQTSIPPAESPTGTITPSSEAQTQSNTLDTSKRFHNPFLPWKNPRTGNWHGPAYSLRRQADLFKLAKAYDVLPLMPLSNKHPDVKLQKRIENGLRVQGTGVGKKVKGKLWERQLGRKLEERRKAMEGMPEMIKQWKERGHGRGWKKWPK
ncbi:uncharacterized protein MYCFIDRAFT_77863 [Pseudocercospora fijiensis CIRAD86]|uniref:Large ribosomal subunit protein mL59 domain-containing protein n=1 Tax=Pseudocercospora fijiensis (strain CIRAD86) TaxID=383855 RepID=M2YQS5_PSEFD|nr:uncharacterized protein MYCFIDRAFT_77863 [Pseudocercospora fijiensis CIRAD86]EME80080.1 hypothetical protein MYCFIDRAFT_77863 [Pseudocercospora fijiensis CIRAD86]